MASSASLSVQKPEMKKTVKRRKPQERRDWVSRGSDQKRLYRAIERPEGGGDGGDEREGRERLKMGMLGRGQAVLDGIKTSERKGQERSISPLLLSAPSCGFSHNGHTHL